VQQFKYGYRCIKQKFLKEALKKFLKILKETSDTVWKNVLEDVEVSKTSSEFILKTEGSF
jgi:hypothetical protein